MDNLSVGFYRRIAAKIWARAIPIKQPQIDLNRQTEIMFILVICICITRFPFSTAELCRYVRFNRYENVGVDIHNIVLLSVATTKSI